MKSTRQIYDQHARIYRALTERARRRARAAHPDTDGSPHLTLNWGNAGAKAAWAAHATAAAQVDAIYHRLYYAAEHREHHARGFRPLWCAECTPKKRVVAHGR